MVMEPNEQTPAPEPRPGSRQIMRDFLSRYRHPNAINAQDWTETDVERLARVMECSHVPNPHDRRRCGRCGAQLYAEKR
jgi:uncharacterized paraquat-inducible protein A